MTAILWLLGNLIGNALDPTLWLGAFAAAAWLRNWFLALFAGAGVGIANDFLIRSISPAYSGQMLGGKILSAIVFTAIACSVMALHRRSRSKPQ